MAKDTELKGEHFSKNNPDMKLYFEKPTRAEIDEMGYCHPITSYKNVEKFLLWLEKAVRHKDYNEFSGATIAYKIERNANKVL